MLGYKNPPPHEVVGLARRLVAQHGDNAALEAAGRADDALDQCDFGAQKKWILVWKTIGLVQGEQLRLLL